MTQGLEARLRTGVMLVATCLLAALPATLSDDQLKEIEKALKADSAEALEMARGAAAVTPLDPEAQALLGLALLRQGHIERAGEALLLALDLDPSCADAHFGLGKIAYGKNRLEAAVAHLRTAASSTRFRMEVFLTLSDVFADGGRPDAALQATELAAKESDYLTEPERAALESKVQFFRSLRTSGTFKLPDSFQKTTVDIITSEEVTEGRGPMDINLRINGMERGRFRIDTSYTGVIMVSGSLAGRLSLEPVGWFPVQLRGEGEREAGGSVLETLEIGGLSVSRVPAQTLRGPTFTGEIDGLVGMGLLKRFNFSIDFRGSVLQLYRGDRPDLLEWNVDRPQVVARVPIFMGPMPVIGVSVNESKKLPFILDTTARVTAVDKSYFEEHIAPSLAADTELEAASSGARAAQSTQVFTAHSVSFGSIELEKISIAVLDLSSIEKRVRQRVVGILGLDVLSRFRLHYNTTTAELIFETIY